MDAQTMFNSSKTHLDVTIVQVLKSNVHINNTNNNVTEPTCKFKQL